MRCRLALIVIALALLTIACKGDGPGRNGPLDRSPTQSLPAAADSAVEALRLYLKENGLDDAKGELTDPLDCVEADSADAGGRFCIVVNAGVYAPGLAIMFVTDRDQEDSWQVHVDPDPQTSEWKVTEAKLLGR